ncbi:MAG: hypothetical protein AAFU85_21520 [Planctomycetota bacterium]
MRIPSQFNDSSLYRPDRGRGDRKSNPARHSLAGSSGEWRRLIRLGVALLFVVMMMREAARPGVYQPFFESSAAESNQWREVDAEPDIDNPRSVALTAVTSDVDLPSGEDTTSAQEGLGQGDSVETDGWDASPWVALLDPVEQRVWAVALVRWSGGPSRQTEPLATQTIANGINLLDQLDRESDKEVRAALVELNPDEDPDWESIRWWAVPMLTALDTAALRRVVDGTFWTGDDTDALYLQLAMSDRLPSENAESVGTLPLLHEPLVYQGKRLRLTGRVGRYEQKLARPNPFGVEKYWRIWMVPNDGGVRPIAFYTTNLPKELSDHFYDGEWNVESATSNPKGEFVAVGRFIKRLPYRSEVGSDLAPVVIGRIVATRDTNRVIATPVKPVPKKAVTWQTAGTFAAVVFGVAIAVFLMKRASAEAKRSRELRQRAWASAEIEIAPNFLREPKEGDVR